MTCWCSDSPPPTIFDKIPSDYHGRPVIRAVVVAILIAGIAVGIMANANVLLNFPEHFMNFIHNINWTYVGIGVGGFVVLTAGAAFVIHRAVHKQDRVLETDIGKFSGDEQWVSAAYTVRDGGTVHIGYIDTSTLLNGSGKAFMYRYKDEPNHYQVCLAVTAFTPLHMVGSIVYNVIRTVVIPFFILGNMCGNNAHSYGLRDIPREMGNSIERIVKAPFYAVAVIYAALYGLIDPLNGRKLGALLEREWNEGLTLAEGWWSVGCGQTLWKFEGGSCSEGWDPNNLGKNGFLIAGCWQPIAVVHFGDQSITAKNLTKVLRPTHEKAYDFKIEWRLRAP